MPQIGAVQSVEKSPLLQLHLEPNEPIEVGELTATLGSLARQYQSFVEKDGVLGKSSDARLLVWSVSPGSIDIAFLPDLQAVAGILTAAYDPMKHILDFAIHIRDFLKAFHLLHEKSDKRDEEYTVRDCDDAVNIVAPTANHGGKQVFNVYNGEVFMPIINISSKDAQEISSNSQILKSSFRLSNAEIRERVPMLWNRLDRERARTESNASPDRALIEEIDPKPHPVFFTDKMKFLKDRMIGDDENPYQRVYFVDVEVSAVQGKVTSYRIIGFHGKEDLT